MRAHITVRADEEIYRAVQPSGETTPDDRSSISLTHADDTLVLDIEADDPSAMRAAINTWLRLISVATDTSGLADEHSENTE